jgi:hypothetical protein
MALMFGILIGGLGMFRYIQVAALAREGCRWASVRGSQYASDTGKSAATSTTVQTYILSEAVGMDTTQLSSTTAWSPDQTQGSTVTVKVTYKWFPEAYVVGSITLQSTAEATQQY